MNSSLLLVESKVWKTNALRILARRKLTGGTLKIMVKILFCIELLYNFHSHLRIGVIFVALFTTSVELKELGCCVCGVKRE